MADEPQTPAPEEPDDEEVQPPVVPGPPPGDAPEPFVQGG